MRNSTPKINHFATKFLDGFIGLAWALGLDGEVLHASSQTLRKGSIEASELSDKKLWEGPWCHDENSAALLRQLYHKALEGEDVSSDKISLSLDGETCPVAMRICPFRNEPDEVEFLLATAVDNSSELKAKSEAKLMKEILGQKDTEFKVMADNMPQLAWMAEPDGNIFWYNQRWMNYTGMSIEELRGMSWKKVHHPEHVERVLENYKLAFMEKDHWEDRFPLRRFDGEYRWFLSRAYPVKNKRGETLRWFGTNTDITNDMEMGELKDKFLSIIGHELRNPLAALQSGLDLFATGSLSIEEGPEIFEMMTKQTEVLKSLIDQVLEVSRFARKKIQLKTEKRNINDMMDQIIGEFSKAVASKEIAFDYSCVKEGLVCDLDVPQFKRLVHALLENAIKFSNQKGKILVSLEREGDQAKISVKDEGKGIETKNLERVFDVFFQEGDKLLGKNEGLGIGLHIAKEISDLHRGKIWAESAGKGLGSAFYVAVPLFESKTPPPKLVPTKGRKILLVEDNNDLGRMMQLKLEALGHEVLRANDGVEAVKFAQAHTPEIILMDIGMPGMNGFEAAKKIRESKWSKEMKIIALTGWGQAEDRRKSKEAGFDMHLVKPVPLKTLIEAIENERKESV